MAVLALAMALLSQALCGDGGFGHTGSGPSGKRPSLALPLPPVPLPQLAPLPLDPVTFTGALMGVHVWLDLYEKHRWAHVRLSGVPVGGRLEGKAVFGWRGKVVMDDAFERSLRRRFCSVTGVARSDDGQSVVVNVTLPIVGQKSIVLKVVKKGD